MPSGRRLDEPAQREYAERIMQLLVAFADAWKAEQQTSGQSFAEGAPRPEPELRVRPRI